MQRTMPRRAAAPSAVCAVLTALAIIFGCAPEASAEGLESTGTTGVFVSLATTEEDGPSGQEGSRQDSPGEKPAATEGRNSAESLPEKLCLESWCTKGLRPLTVEGPASC